MIASALRLGGGLWGVALAAAVVVPVVVEAASAHRGHWPSAGAFWAELTVPGAARTWSLVVLVALAGWSAGAGPADPRPGRSAVAGIGAAGIGFAVAALAALPAWVWLARLGAAPPIALATSAGWSLVAPAVGSAVAGVGAAWLGEVKAAAAGALAGGIVLWAVWGLY